MYRRARLGIGYLPQGGLGVPRPDGEENIRAVLEIIEPSRDLRERASTSCCRSFPSPSAEDPGRGTSGANGERRDRRAIASRPNFILLDEPFAGIRSHHRRRHPLARQYLKDRGIGVLVTDHNVSATLDIVRSRL